MRFLQTTFLKGLLAVVPITATVYLLVWLGKAAEDFFADVVTVFFPSLGYIPGLGIFVGVTAILLIGLLLNAWVAQRALAWAENVMAKLPLIKSIYTPMKDLMGFFSTNGKKGMNRVVLVNIDQDRQIMGLLTRESLKEFKELAADKVAVYFPLSYQIGGMTIFVPRSQIQEVDIPVEKALKLMITGFVDTK